MNKTIKVVPENISEWTRRIHKSKTVFVQVAGLHDVYPFQVSKAKAILFLKDAMDCGFELRTTSHNETFIDRAEY